MKKKLFTLGFLFLFTVIIANDKPEIDEDYYNCSSWAASILEAVEDASGCMSAEEYNADYHSLMNYCQG